MRSKNSKSQSTDKWKPYHHCAACNETMSANDIFQRWKDERRATINYLSAGTILKHLWTDQSPLSFDRHCLWQMGEKNENTNYTRGIRRANSCTQCRNLERLIDLNDHSPFEPFLLEAGPYEGKKMYIDSVPVSYLDIRELIESSDLMVKKINDLGFCTPSNVKGYLESDSFTHEMLISWILQQLGEERGSYFNQVIYTSFVCGDKGYMLKENLLPLGKLDTQYKDSQGALTPEIVKDLLIQLTIICNSLEKVEYLHQYYKSDALMIDETPFNYQDGPKGKKYSSVLSLKLANVEHATLTFNVDNNPLRIIPQSPYRDKYADTFDYFSKKNIGKINGDTLQFNGIGTKIYSQLQKIGFYMCNSYDTYGLLLSMMIEPTFGRVVLENISLSEIWKSLWPDGPQSVNRDLFSIWNGDQLTVDEILSHTKIRRDISSHLKNALQV